MTKRRLHLMLCMHRTSWGRTLIAFKIANDLRRNGDLVHFVTHRAASALFEGSNLDVDFVDDHLGGLLKLYLDEIVRTTQPSSILLCDFFSNVNFLLRRGVQPSFIWGHRIPVIALDTWNFNKTGMTIDVGCGKSMELVWNGRSDVMNLFDQLSGRIIPAPLSPIDSDSNVFNCLPEVMLASRKQREIVRNRFGVEKKKKLILFCTATWQQASYHDPDSTRLANAFPRLLGSYLKSFDSDVHLIHVGPSRLAVMGELVKRYQWIGQLATNEFDALLTSVDLLLSANISATILSRAILAGIPSIVIQNSIDADTLDDVINQMNVLSPKVEFWLKKVLPIFPFRLWPLGYYRFLEPLLRDNPFSDACAVVELLDDEKLTYLCHNLLFNKYNRQSLIDSQYKYIKKVQLLPNSANLLDSILC